MGTETSRRYHSISVDGLDPTSAERIAIAVLDGDEDLRAHQLRRGRISVNHDYRPTWALVACICSCWIVGLGFLFLLVRRSDSGELTVVGSSRGVVVTVPPVVPVEVRERLDTQLRTGRLPDAPDTAATTTNDTADRPAGSTGSAGSVPAPPPPPSLPPPTTPAQPGIPPPPGAAGDGLDDHTVARSGTASTSSGPAPSTPAATSARLEPNRLVLGFPEGTVTVETGETVILGRSPSPRPGCRAVAVPGDGSTLSKAHLLVRFTGQRIEIEDLGSTNGSRVGTAGPQVHTGERIEITPGDVIVLGTVACTTSLATDGVSTST